MARISHLQNTFIVSDALLYYPHLIRYGNNLLQVTLAINDDEELFIFTYLQFNATVSSSKLYSIQHKEN